MNPGPAADHERRLLREYGDLLDALALAVDRADPSHIETLLAREREVRRAIEIEARRPRPAPPIDDADGASVRTGRQAARAKLRRVRALIAARRATLLERIDANAVPRRARSVYDATTGGTLLDTTG